MSNNQREEFLQASVMGASPGRLVVMLYDRLALDLSRAEKAIVDNSPSDAHSHIMHAQDIIEELWTSLDVSQWSDAVNLENIYIHALSVLREANLLKSSEKVKEVYDLMQPLRESWHQALQELEGQASEVFAGNSSVKSGMTFYG